MSLPFTLQQLRILKAVASEKSFTKAAEILFVSQPSLSKQIKTLEHRLGILLFNRENQIIRSLSLPESAVSIILGKAIKLGLPSNFPQHCTLHFIVQPFSSSSLFHGSYIFNIIECTYHSLA